MNTSRLGGGGLMTSLGFQDQHILKDRRSRPIESSYSYAWNPPKHNINPSNDNPQSRFEPMRLANKRQSPTKRPSPNRSTPSNATPNADTAPSNRALVLSSNTSKLKIPHISMRSAKYTPSSKKTRRFGDGRPSDQYNLRNELDFSYMQPFDRDAETTENGRRDSINLSPIRRNNESISGHMTDVKDITFRPSLEPNSFQPFTSNRSDDRESRGDRGFHPHSFHDSSVSSNSENEEKKHMEDDFRMRDISEFATRPQNKPRLYQTDPRPRRQQFYEGGDLVLHSSSNRKGLFDGTYIRNPCNITVFGFPFSERPYIHRKFASYGIIQDAFCDQNSLHIAYASEKSAQRALAEDGTWVTNDTSQPFLVGVKYTELIAPLGNSHQNGNSMPFPGIGGRHIPIDSESVEKHVITRDSSIVSKFFHFWMQGW